MSRGWIVYRYATGRVNRYGHPIPDNYDTLDGRTRQSFAMMGNRSAKGHSHAMPTRESVSLDRILDRIERIALDEEGA
jgi:hypothetical protein